MKGAKFVSPLAQRIMQRPSEYSSASSRSLSENRQALNAFVYLRCWTAASAERHHGEFDFSALIHFFGLFLIAEALLRYYNARPPWTNVSVHQLFPETGR